MRNSRASNLNINTQITIKKIRTRAKYKWEKKLLDYFNERKIEQKQIFYMYVHSPVDESRSFIRLRPRSLRELKKEQRNILPKSGTSTKRFQRFYSYSMMQFSID